MLKKILQLVLSKEKFQKVVHESKQWFLVHDKCGYSVSIWDSGGIRFGASSKYNRVLKKCPKCKERVFFTVIKNTKGDNENKNK